MTKAPVARKRTPKVRASNVIDDPTQSLQTFDLLDLQQYTQEKVYSTTASKDFIYFTSAVTMSTISSNTFCLASAFHCISTCSGMTTTSSTTF